MSMEIDFTRAYWGHALHAETWRPDPRQHWWQRWVDRCRNVRRYSVMVHSAIYPRPGMSVRYRIQGGLAEAKIAWVKACFDPGDMFTLGLVLRAAPTESQEDGDA